VTSLFGIPVVSSPYASALQFDWTGCRSPSRARRRYKQGHPQRVKITREPVVMMLGGQMFAHPDVIAELRRQTERLSNAGGGFGRL